MFKEIMDKSNVKDPKKGLGYLDMAQEIKKHPWYSDVNWVELYHRKVGGQIDLVKFLGQSPVQAKADG